MIKLRTLGALGLTSADGTPLASVLAQPRRTALLCYLALESPRGFQRRDTLYALFWPEHSTEQARHALRQSLYFLRHELGPEAIVSRGDDALAVAADRVNCDAVELDRAAHEGRLEDALALYRGDLLEGFHITGAPDFERWLEEERSRLRHRAEEAGWAAAAARERDGDPAGAVEAARRAAALAPTDETALRRLILLLERVGDRAAAVCAYEAFAWKLQGEYELEPSAETQALVERIRAEPGQTRAAAPGPQNGSSPAAGDGNSKVRMREAAPSTGPRQGAADLLRDFEFQSPGLVTGPTRVTVPSRAPRTGAIATGVVTLLLLGLVGFYLRTQARDHTLGDPHPTTVGAAPGVAVLPFAVQDSALANWREGLVDLVSLDLSGITGLRAVDSRTLLARWREQVTGAEIPELATALEVAERAGARYAVVGSVIANGPELLLTVGVHEVAGRRMLGTARSQGPTDSIFTLVDRLTVEILRLILRGEAPELPHVNLARVSTASLPALKSYLEGEVLFRRSQFQSAAEAYAMAVEADSNFALAQYRLGLSRWWTGSLPNRLGTELGRFVERLPRQEAAVLRADQLRELDIRAARELLEQEVRQHPDRAETWHELGELYYHDGTLALVPAEAADRAFARAIELDSTFTLPYLHRIEYAVSTRDTTGAARLLGTFARLAPESPYVPRFGLMTELAFGDPAERSAAEAVLDTLEGSELYWLGLLLEAPRCCWHLSEQVMRKMREHRELRADATRELCWVSLAQGKAREALGWVDDPFMPEDSEGRMLSVLDELGVPIPPARLDAALTLVATDSADAVQIFYAGSYAVSRARWHVLRGSLERLQSSAQRLRSIGDSSKAGFTEAVRQALEGYASWRRGQRERALGLLERSQPRAVGDWRRRSVNTRLRWWLGRLLVEMGRPREALPYFESLSATALPADYERGRIYEQLGELQRAREAYALFLAPRQQADRMFQPMIQSAQAALQRLAVATRD